MTREDVERIARAVSDPVRLEILSRIGQSASDEFACADLKTAFDLTPATISHHMKELQEAELIEARREGKFMNYRLNRPRWAAYLRELKRLVPEK